MRPTVLGVLSSALLLSATTFAADPAPAAKAAGCDKLPEVRAYVWAWNAQMGWMLATGGKQATADSLMCKNGVNLKLIREDNTDTMAALMVTFAEALKKGEANPALSLIHI